MEYHLALPKEYFLEGLDAGVESAVRAGIEVLADLGAEVSEMSLPHTMHALAVYYIIAPSEASSNLARYDGVKYGHSAEADTMWGALAANIPSPITDAMIRASAETELPAIGKPMPNPERVIARING